MIKTKLYYMDDNDCHHDTQVQAVIANKKIKLAKTIGGEYASRVAEAIIYHYPSIQRIMES